MCFFSLNTRITLFVIQLQESRINIFSKVCLTPALGKIFSFLQGWALGSTPLQTGHGRQEYRWGTAVCDPLWKWGVTYSRSSPIIQISPCFFICSSRQGGAPGRRCYRWDGDGKGRGQEVPAGSRTEVNAPTGNVPGKPVPRRRVHAQAQRMGIPFPLPFPF